MKRNANDRLSQIKGLQCLLLPLKCFGHLSPPTLSRLNYMSKPMFFKSWNKWPACRGPSVPDAFSKISSSFYYANSVYLKS